MLGTRWPAVGLGLGAWAWCCGTGSTRNGVGVYDFPPPVPPPPRLRFAASLLQISEWRRDYSWKPGQEPQPDEEGPETYLAQRWARGCCWGADGRKREAACQESAA